MTPHDKKGAQELHAKLEKYETTAFNPNRGGYNGAACYHALHEYGGFWGPFVFP